MSRAKIVAGALVEGDAEGEDVAGNAGGWIHLELMVEEVRAGLWGGGGGGCVWGGAVCGGGSGICARAQRNRSPVGGGCKYQPKLNQNQRKRGESEGGG